MPDGTTGRTITTRVGRLIAGLVLALLALPALGGVALAADGDPPGASPAPYGGLLDSPDPGEQVGGDQVLEVALLTVGCLNGLAFAGAMIASRLRGSSHAATRRALSARTGRGRVSEAPRRRRPDRAPAAHGANGPRGTTNG